MPRISPLQGLGLARLAHMAIDATRGRGLHPGLHGGPGGDLIVGQRATQAASDSASLVPLAEQVERTCGARPVEVSADSGFFSVPNLQELGRRGIEGKVPDAHLTGELQRRREPL